MSGPGRSPLDDLERWAAEARARDAAEARVRQRWLRTQAEEDATLAAVLLEMAERADEVTVRTAAGRSHAGKVLAVGGDFLALRPGSSGFTAVVLGAIATVAPGPRNRRAPAADVGPRPPLDAALVELLALATGDRPRVTVECGTHLQTGELRAVGQDVITLRPVDGPGPVFVALHSVSAVSFLDSG